MPFPRLRIHLSLETPDTRPPLRGWLARQFRAAATALGVTAGEITLAIVDDARMSEVHRRHLGIAGPTDVITFDLRDSPAMPRCRRWTSLMHASSTIARVISPADAQGRCGR